VVTKQLSFQAPVALALAEGATTPDPGIAGVSCWSTTLAKPVFWTGSQAGTSGGGGSATISQALVTLPYSRGGLTVANVVNVGVSASSKIIVNLAGTDENEADDIDDWVVTATPQAGSIDFNIYCPGPFGGSVAINCMIG
jgi:hypothetical protein